MSNESLYQGAYSLKMQETIKIGVILFILREVIFFFRIFWAFFHFALNPVGEVGFQFPAAGLDGLNPYSIPLYNTVILVSSGLTLTISHNYILLNQKSAIKWLLITIGLGLAFTRLQLFEYYVCSFTFSSANYGTIFFMSTGFHGFHVIIGTLLLVASLSKIFLNKFNNLHHTFYEGRIWYWHFVDVVWLFLYLSVYFWAK
jgi:cytochrome c oxidase subunit 3